MFESILRILECQEKVVVSVYRVFLHYHGKTSKFEAMKADYGVVYDCAAVA